MSSATPFKFLDAYTKEDASRFFGRSKETAQLYNAVYASNLTLLYGSSGVGKTSLVQCGLANKFHDSDWAPVFINRGEDINRALSTAIGEALEEKPGEAFGALPLQEQARRLFLEKFRPVYLIFDQFEELYIKTEKEERIRFYQSIQGLLGAGLQARVLFSIREEWIAYLNEMERYLPSLLNNRLRLEHMNDATVLAVLRHTIPAAGIGIEPPEQAVLEAILENIRDQREGIELTDLQIYLDRLYRRALAGKEQPSAFNLALVEEVGPMKNALSLFLDEQLAQMEERLRDERGISNPRGIPVEILFTLVTNDKTKQARSLENIRSALPRNRRLKPEDIQFCLDEFNRIKLLNQFE